MKTLKKFITPAVFFVVFAILSFAFAASTLAQQGNVPPGDQGGYEIPNPLGTNTFDGLVQSIAKWFLYIMVPVASIMVLYAGFLFMTSAGDEEKVKKAKRAITYAVVGVAIILIGAGFVTLIKSLLTVK